MGGKSLKELVFRALEAANADYCEIRIEETHQTSLVYRGRNLDDIAQSLNFGGNVRAQKDGGWGFVSFNSLADL